MESVLLSKGIDIRYEKFIKPKLSEKQIQLIKQLSEEIKKELLSTKK
ncbi:MAG: hypothetical protein ACD_80C00012G0011 [uncultured bacterium (gcode 4)]|uniref:Uncharacterized protein n=1 Tax=uncultured bacterium (gcode 4) TaxID=1234023 RepID=K1X5U2_9BACT|nr:MAG: hypothetical protein ACD_80C00012G0011 [uncultured bacterium (gcode 4)]